MNKFFFCLLNFHLDCVISSSIFAEISLTLNLRFNLDCFKLCKFSNKFFWIFSCSSKFCLSPQKKIRYSSCCCTFFISQAMNNYKSWNENLLFKRREDEIVCLILEVSLTKFSCLSVTAIDLSSLTLPKISLVASGLIVLITAIR